MRWGDKDALPRATSRQSFLCAALHPEAHFEPRPTHINVLLSKLKNLGTYKLHSENLWNSSVYYKEYNRFLVILSLNWY